MNIFVLDDNPVTAARFHNDRHVVKMIEASCQLLALAHQVTNVYGIPPAAQMHAMNDPAHTKHPCARWVRSDPYNYDWVHTLCGALLMEFQQRYGHAHGHVSKWEALWGAPMLACTHELTGRPLCMPDDCRVAYPQRGQRPLVWDPVASYRNYYVRQKGHLASWYNGDASRVPPWFKVEEQV